MIVLVGVHTDPVLAYFADYIRFHTQLNCIFINQHRVGVTIHLSESHIYFPKRAISVRCISGVLNRAVGGEDLANASAAQQRGSRILWYVLQYVWPNVLNRPNACSSNSSKPYQLALIRKHGGGVLHIPDSKIVANGRCPTGYAEQVFKSISSVRSIVMPVDSTMKKRWVMEPVMFQQRLDGQNIRVHVVGGGAHAVAVDAEALDYRYCLKSVFIQEINICLSVVKACVDITKALGLGFSGIDLIRVQDGRYFILEVNPCPGYLYFESMVKTRSISAALCEQLQGG